MAPGDSQPTLPLPDWAAETMPSRRRGRGWPWIIVLLVVAALALAAWFAAEALARDFVTKTIEDQIRTQLSLPADHEIDVEVAGAVVPQLIVGSLADVTIASDDVPLGELTGDVTVHAMDVPVHGGGDWSGADATVSLDEDQLRALMATVDGFPEETLGLADPNVTMSLDLQLLLVTFPVGVALTPSAVDGDIVLSPAALQLGDAEITADELRERFGGLADAVLRDWTICIAQYMPAGVTLTDAQVEGGEFVAGFEVAIGIVTDPALQANGTCE